MIYTYWLIVKLSYFTYYYLILINIHACVEIHSKQNILQKMHIAEFLSCITSKPKSLIQFWIDYVQIPILFRCISTLCIIMIMRIPLYYTVHNTQWHPSKHEIFTQYWFNVRWAFAEIGVKMWALTWDGVRCAVTATGAERVWWSPGGGTGTWLLRGVGPGPRCWAPQGAQILGAAGQWVVRGAVLAVPCEVRVRIVFWTRARLVDQLAMLHTKRVGRSLHVCTPGIVLDGAAQSTQSVYRTRTAELSSDRSTSLCVVHFCHDVWLT